MSFSDVNFSNVSFILIICSLMSFSDVNISNVSFYFDIKLKKYAAKHLNLIKNLNI